MSEFLFQIIPYLRTTSDGKCADFLTALEEVLELGSRYVVRLGGATIFAGVDDFMIGPRGLSVAGAAGTSILIPFDATLKITPDLPDHFHMPLQPSTQFRRTAFGYVSGADRTFGMIARDDEMEPGRHAREALTDALGNIKKIASLNGRSPSVTLYSRKGPAKERKGITIDVDGFHTSTGDVEAKWKDITMFEIADRVIVTCQNTAMEISAS